MKFRKKPVVIEAVELQWSTWSEMCDFIKQDIKGIYLDDKTFEVLEENKTSNTMGLVIKTLEGDMVARQGDFVIKGVNGEFYPCKPDIFEKTYEIVE